MKKIIQAYRFLNILSIDIVAGSVICALFFAKIFGVTVLPYGLISLGLTVWIIYTAFKLFKIFDIKTNPIHYQVLFLYVFPFENSARLKSNRDWLWFQSLTDNSKIEFGG